MKNGSSLKSLTIARVFKSRFNGMKFQEPIRANQWEIIWTSILKSQFQKGILKH